MYLNPSLKQECDWGGVMVNGCKRQDVRENNSRREIQQGCVFILHPQARTRTTHIHKQTTAEWKKKKKEKSQQIISKPVFKLKYQFPV